MVRTLPLAVAASTALVVTLVLAGCTTVERHPDIPAEAMMGSEGTTRLAYNAPENGMVYVYDVTAEQIVYAGRVDRDETVVVDPERDRITVDGRAVSEERLRAGNQHRLYFLKEGEVQERVIHTEELRIEESR